MVLFGILFNLWATTAAVAAAAVSIPIIIHLLNRRRFKIVDWAAMRFLLKAQKQTTRKLRLEQILLLLVRCLLLLLLVMAMASVMPWAEDLWAWINPAGATTRSYPEGKVHHILVIDGSLSMNQTVDKDKGTPAFQKALDEAVKTVRRARAGDGFTLLLLKDVPDWRIPNPTDLAPRIPERIEKLTASHGNAAFSSALAAIQEKIKAGEKYFQTQVVYFYTDMQGATWQTRSMEARKEKADEKEAKAREIEDEQRQQIFKYFEEQAQVVLVDVGADGADNVAVVDLYLPYPLVTSGQKLQVHAKVKNFGTVSRKLKVKLQVSTSQDFKGASALTSEEIDLGASEDQTFAFHYLLARPGTYVFKVEVETSAGTDPLVLDDARYLVVPVPESVPILVVGGIPPGPATRAEKQEHLDRLSWVLQAMLNPDPGHENGEWTSLLPQAITQEEFAGLGPAELEKYQCVFLVDIGAPSEQEVKNLRWLLRRGKGVVMSVGDNTAAQSAAINDALYRKGTGLMPARLDREIKLSAPHYYLMGTREEKEFTRPPLKAFSDERDKISLQSRPFMKYLQSNEVRGRTILNFERVQDEKAPVLDAEKDPPTGDAALVEWNPPMLPGEDRGASSRQTYPGKFVLFTSTFHRKQEEEIKGNGWNDWAGTHSFGSMVQELVRLAVPGRLMGQAAVVGEPLEGSVNRGREKVWASLHFPTVPGVKDQPEPQQKVFPAVEEFLEYGFGRIDFAGVYRLDLTKSSGEKIVEPVLFAVNPPAVTTDKVGSESDLTRWGDKELKGLYPGFAFDLIRDADKVALRPGPRAGQMVEERAEQGPTFARYFLWAFLGLLFLEIILAWQFGHYTKVEGTEAPAPLGLTWPLAIAGAGLVLFLVGAFVVFDAKNRGEFLGFMPDRFRTWMESRVLNLDAPKAGESSNWTYVERPWLPEFLDRERGWFLLFASVAALALVLFVYLMEGPTVSGWFKGLLAGLRFFLIMMTIHWLMPQPENNLNRSDKPVLIVLIDTSLSMGVSDELEDEASIKRAKDLSGPIKAKLKESLPGRINELKTEIEEEEKKPESITSPRVEGLRLQLKLLESQWNLLKANSPAWRPSRLNLAQQVMLDPNNDWLNRLIKQKHTHKVHLFHLNAEGKADEFPDPDDPKIGLGMLTDAADVASIEKARKALGNLQAHGRNSYLGQSLAKVIDQHRGPALTAVIMVTDGVNTREETLGSLEGFLKGANVPVFFFGLGVEKEDPTKKSIRLTDLQVKDTVYLGDRAMFQGKVVYKGYRGEVPIVLRVKEKDGREKEVDRGTVKLNDEGTERFSLKHVPEEVGKKTYVIEIIVPKDKEKRSGYSRVRLERTIEVIDPDQIKVLYVEGQARYEYRYLKSLLERESPDERKRKSVRVHVLLLDADADWHEGFGEEKVREKDKEIREKRVLKELPSRAELARYNVIIIGDVDPHHPLLGKKRLEMIADRVRGDEKGDGGGGAGLLFLSGPFHSPHAFKDTPLAPLLPVTTVAATPPAEPEERKKELRLNWTTLGRLNNLFKLVPNDVDNLTLWKRLQPMYWWPTGYRVVDNAEVLATSAGEGAGIPLIVELSAGKGRSLFFGFEETWRWRRREHEAHYNDFWIQTMRYLARVQHNRTEVRLDKQVPYKEGEEDIKITVTFPDSVTSRKAAKGDEEVTIISQHWAADREGNESDKAVESRLSLAKVGENDRVYQTTLPKNQVQAGRYKFTLYTPNVREYQPDKKDPFAEAIVELPPLELEDLKLNMEDLRAARGSDGQVYTLADVHKLPDDVEAYVNRLFDPGESDAGKRTTPVTGFSVARHRLWNHWLVFGLVVLLFTGEWILRKKKHLL